MQSAITPAAPLSYASRLIAASALTGDVWQLRLQKPEHAIEGLTDWQFGAGQFVWLSLPDRPDLDPRAYSIASGPGRAYIDLHIRDTGHGLSHAASGLVPGAEVLLSAAQGRGLPAAAHARPLLLVAGGVGIAPMKSLLDDEDLFSVPVHLYWGVERDEQLYLDAYFRDLSVRQPFFYHPLTAEPPGPAILDTLPDLSAMTVYMAGPAAMVAATVPLLVEHGAQKAYIFGDGITL